MSAAASTDALKERERLTLEFAELQALDRSLESLGASVRSFEALSLSEELKEVHREAAAKAFADYDLNKNGVIELNELAYLTAELGYPMDAKELQTALKAINTSGNGKVSFDEFANWWNGAATPASQRDGLALALLRARLWIHKGEKLIAQIGKRKGVHFPDAKAWDTTDAKTHTVSFAVGEFGEAKGGLHYRFHHNLILDADIVNADQKYTLFYSFDLKHTGKADFPSYLRETFRSICDASKHAICSSVSQPKKDVVRLTIGFMLPIPDPAQLLEQYGFNLEQLSRALRLDFEFGTTVQDVFGQQKYTLADLIKTRVKAHIHLEKSMLANVATQVTAMAASNPNRARDFADALTALSVLQNVDTSFSMTAGEVVEVVNGLAEFARGKFGDQSRQMKDLKPFMTVVQESIAALVKKEAARDRKKEFPIVVSAIKAAALTFERDVIEFLQLGAWTRSGVGATAECDRLIRMDNAMIALEFLEKTTFEAYDQLAKEGGATGGSGSGSAAGAKRQLV